MRISQEFQDEQQARARERALQAMGYRAWLNRKGDGAWQLFWLEEFYRPAVVTNEARPQTDEVYWFLAEGCNA